jgi:aminopeptidase N
MWIHEGFTAYSENLFLDYYYGKEASADYVIGTRNNIKNTSPIIGDYNVNSEGSSDMYYKGANMLNTIRQLVNDDEKWRTILRGLNKDFYHQTVNTAQIENYMSEKLGLDLSKVFDQYLRTAQIPVLDYKIDGKKISYRYTDVVKDFKMPLKAKVGNKEIRLQPTENWQTENIKADLSTFKIDRNYYINTRKL